MYPGRLHFAMLKERTGLKSTFHMIKRWDIIITILFVLLSFLPVYLFNYQQSQKMAALTGEVKNIAVISVNGQEVERYTLTGHTGMDKLTIPEVPCGDETVEVLEEKIRVKFSDCPDQICVMTSYISSPGPAIICLPHRVVIKVEQVGGSADEMIIST